VRALWAFPVAIAILSVAFPPDPEDRWIVPVAVAGFGALMVVMTLEVFRRRILVGEHGIEQRSAWSSPLVIAWKDVREVALNLSSEIEVRPQRGRAIRVSLWLSGLESFARALEQHAGHLPSTAKAVLRIRAFRA
jgi:hypothetical protein